MGCDLQEARSLGARESSAEGMIRVWEKSDRYAILIGVDDESAGGLTDSAVCPHAVTLHGLVWRLVAIREIGSRLVNLS